MTSPTRVNELTPIQFAAMAVAAVLLLAGILSLVPGITQNWDQMSFLSQDSGARMLGAFQVNLASIVVLMGLGFLGLLAARTLAGAKSFLVLGGIALIVVWLYGLIIDLGSAANFLALNGATMALLLIVGLAMLAIAVLFPAMSR